MATGTTPLSGAQIWKATLGELKGQMTASTYNTHLVGSKALKYENGKLTIGVYNQFTAQWLLGRLRESIERTVKSIDGRVEAVLFEVEGEGEAEPQPPAQPRNQSDLTGVWEAAVPALVNCVLDKTNGTGRPFLAKATLASWEDGLATVEVLSTHAASWLNKPNLRGELERILSAASGKPTTLHFLVKASDWEDVQSIGAQMVASKSLLAQEPKTAAPTSETNAEGEEPKEVPPETPIQIKMVASDPMRAFMPLSHYANRFWKAYVGSSAFSLWELLCSYGYYVGRGGNEWPTVELLAASLEGDRHTILGRKRKIDGRESYSEGLLVKLERARLARHYTEVDPEKPTMTVHNFAVYPDLPMLSPAQVATLPQILQTEHGRFLSFYRGFPADAWARAQEATFIPEWWHSNG